MAVVAPDGVVGHVIDSWHGGAKVRVLTDPESRDRGAHARSIRSTGIAQGTLGQSRARRVSDFDAGAKVRARVTTS